MFFCGKTLSFSCSCAGFSGLMKLDEASFFLFLMGRRVGSSYCSSKYIDKLLLLSLNQITHNNKMHRGFIMMV